MRNNISQFTTYTGVYGSLKNISYAKGAYCYVESPASQPSVTRLFWSSHPLPPQNTSAPLGYPDARWPEIPVPQVSHVQYIFACQKWQLSMPSNMVKSGLTWSRVFRRRHLGRRVTAVTRLRWPTVIGLGKDNCKTRRETFKFWLSVRLILEILRYIKQVLRCSLSRPPSTWNRNVENASQNRLPTGCLGDAWL